MKYLDKHIRLDTNEVFYVGIGGKYRPNQKNRNTIWKRIVAKTDYKIEIILESNDYEFIKQKEIELIKFYGRINLGNGTLANLTDGGEGTIGLKMSDERKRKHSEIMKIKNLERYRNEEYISYAKPLYQYDLKGNLIKRYRSFNNARKSIKRCIKIIRKVLNNYTILESSIWFNEFMGNKIIIDPLLVKHSEKVLQYDLDGNFINMFKDVYEASFKCFGNRTGCNYIGKVCKGKLKDYKNYIWKYENFESCINS